MPAIKSILKPEGSIVAGIAVSGSVAALYSLGCGNMAQVHYSDANMMSIENSRKKCAATAFLFVSALTVLTKDANVGLLGFGTIIAMEIAYRHAIMADPSSGIVQPPAESTYTPAENVRPLYAQADAG